MGCGWSNSRGNDGDANGDGVRDFAVELVERAKEMVAGIYLMPPFERYEMVPAIMEGAGITRERAQTD